MAARIPSAFGGSRATPALWRRWLGLAAAVLGPAAATDGAPALFDGTTGRAIRATTFGAFKSALGLGSVLDVPQREKLTANRTYYVRTDGSDANDGLANTAGGAFLTLQKAMDVVANLDIAIYDVTVNVAAGTYAAGVTLKTVVGAGSVTFAGDETTPANVTIASAGNCVAATAYATVFNVRGFKFASSAGSDVTIGSPTG